MGFDYLFSYIASFTALIPFVYCYKARGLKNRIITALWILLGVDIVVQIISEFYNQAGSSTSIVYFNVYPMLQFFMLSIVYRYLMPHRLVMIYSLMIVYLLFYPFNAVWVEDFNKVQRNPLAVQGVIIITYGILYALQILKEITHDYSVRRDGKFWINLAFFIYFFYSIGLFAFAHYILTNLEPATSRLVWNFHAFNYIVKNVLLSVGIYYLSRVYRPPFEKFGLTERWWEGLEENPNKAKTQEK